MKLKKSKCSLLIHFLSKITMSDSGPFPEEKFPFVPSYYCIRLHGTALTVRIAWSICHITLNRDTVLLSLFFWYMMTETKFEAKALIKLSKLVYIFVSILLWTEDVLFNKFGSFITYKKCRSRDNWNVTLVGGYWFFVFNNL